MTFYCYCSATINCSARIFSPLYLHTCLAERDQGKGEICKLNTLLVWYREKLINLSVKLLFWYFISVPFFLSINAADSLLLFSLKACWRLQVRSTYFANNGDSVILLQYIAVIYFWEIQYILYWMFIIMDCITVDAWCSFIDQQHLFHLYWFKHYSLNITSTAISIYYWCYILQLLLLLYYHYYKCCHYYH